MQLKSIENVKDFLSVVDSCEGDVYLTSQYGDKFNLKSKLSQYIAIAALLSKDGDLLELWADKKEDENKLLMFLNTHNIV